jgi:hypothetical protein
MRQCLASQKKNDRESLVTYERPTLTKGHARRPFTHLNFELKMLGEPELFLEPSSLVPPLSGKIAVGIRRV